MSLRLPLCLFLAMTLGLLPAGCVERTITVTSEPAGALVYLNDEEIGRTPVTVPFTFYGVYDVRMEKSGYQPLWTKQATQTPWWDLPGIDLASEALTHNKVEQKWNFQLEPTPAPDTDLLIDHARQMRSLTQEPSVPATQPMEK